MPQLPYVRRPVPSSYGWMKVFTLLSFFTHEHIFYINVPVDTLRDQLLGPLVLPTRVRGAVYHFFYDLPGLLENECLRQRKHTCFMSDGAPLNFIRIFTQHLNQTFISQWKGRGGPAN